MKPFLAHGFGCSNPLHLQYDTCLRDSTFKGLEFVNLLHPLGTLSDLISRHALILLASVGTAKDVVSGASLFRVDGFWMGHRRHDFSENGGRLPRLNRNRVFRSYTYMSMSKNVLPF